MERVAGVPLFPLNIVLFPGMVMPLNIFEERYRIMIARCLEEKLQFGVVLIREGVEAGGPAIPCEVGTLARIVDAQPQPDGRYQLSVSGTQRFRIVDLHDDQPYLTGDLDVYDPDYTEEGPEGDALKEMADTVGSLFGEYYRLSLTLAEQWQESIALPGHPAALANFVATRFAAPMALKQRVLEAPTVIAALEMEKEILGEAIPMLAASVKERQDRRWGSPNILN